MNVSLMWDSPLYAVDMILLLLVIKEAVFANDLGKKSQAGNPNRNIERK